MTPTPDRRARLLERALGLIRQQQCILLRCPGCAYFTADRKHDIFCPTAALIAEIEAELERRRWKKKQDECPHVLDHWNTLERRCNDCGKTEEALIHERD